MTTTAAPRAASAPAPVHLSAPKQDSPAAIVGVAAVLGLVGSSRWPLRCSAGATTGGSRPIGSPPSRRREAPSERHEPPAPSCVAAEPAPPPRSGLQPGAAVIGCVTGPRVSRPSGRTPERDIQRACERSGWHLVEIVHDDDGDGPAILERPVPARLERIADGEARGLVVNDARMLSRSADFAEFVQWFRESDGRAHRPRPGARHVHGRGSPGRHRARHAQRLGGHGSRAGRAAPRSASARAATPRRVSRSRIAVRSSGALRRCTDRARGPGDRRPAQRRGRPCPLRDREVVAVERADRPALLAGTGCSEPDRPPCGRGGGS